MELVARFLSAYLSRGLTGTAAYLQGSVAARDARFGYSDVDLSLIVPDNRVRPGANRALLSRRWQRLKRRLPLIRRVVDLMAFEQAEVERALRSVAPWRAEGGGSVLEMAVCVRPGLHGPTREWRRLSGPDRRPPAHALEHAADWWAAWAELQFWCRHAFFAVADRRREALPYMTMKLIAEPLRIWLWLEHGIRPRSRHEVLKKAAPLLDDAEALEWARQLPRHIPARQREQVLAAGLRGFFGVAALLAIRLSDEAQAAGSTELRLLGARGPGADGAIPLVDWVARTCPVEIEEWCCPQEGDPADPHALQRAVASSSPPLYSLLRSEHLLVLPVSDLWSSRLRAIQCAVSDPVTFALLEGKGVAHVPDLPVWSVRDCAQRAIADHAGRLRLDDPHAPLPDPGFFQRTGRWLITAVRAALFAESVDSRAPELAMTLEALVAQLSARDPIAAELLADAVASYRANPAAHFRHAQALRRMLFGLEPYARRATGERAAMVPGAREMVRVAGSRGAG